jgi:hypothetical protein
MELAGGFFRESLKPFEILGLEAVEVGQRGDQSALHQFVRGLLAQMLDVEGVAGGVMADAPP